MVKHVQTLRGQTSAVYSLALLSDVTLASGGSD